MFQFSLLCWLCLALVFDDCIMTYKLSDLVAHAVDSSFQFATIPQIVRRFIFVMGMLAQIQLKFKKVPTFFSLDYSPLRLNRLSDLPFMCLGPGLVACSLYLFQEL